MKKEWDSGKVVSRDGQDGETTCSELYRQDGKTICRDLYRQDVRQYLETYNVKTWDKM